MPDELPQYKAFLWPTLVAVREIGDSGTNSEINEAVIAKLGITDEQQAILYGDGPKTSVAMRLHWARSILKSLGLLNNSAREVWATTEHGRAVTEDEVAELLRVYDAEQRARRERKRAAEQQEAEEGEEVEGEDEATDEGRDEPKDWKELLVERLLTLSPEAFERLARRLLREAGFENTEVTGRRGDGGIDGVGSYRLALVSVPVYFQCKRYSGSVGPDEVRDLRGALEGRGDHGLLITTGVFTSGAQQEATRAGAKPIELIDGDRLCDLLKLYELGVRTQTRTIEDVTVHSEFFVDL